MVSPQLESLEAGSLQIEVQRSVHGTVRLDWKGKSDSREPSKILRPFFHRIVEATSSSHSRLEVHFEALEHLNSSTIAEVIQLINDARSHNVSLQLVYAGGLRWQALSFEALKRAMKPFENGAGPTVKFLTAEPG